MKTGKADILFHVLKYLFLILIALVTLFPFVNILAISLNDPLDMIKGGTIYWPRVWSLAHYSNIIEDPDSWLYTFNLVSRTVIQHRDPCPLP